MIVVIRQLYDMTEGCLYNINNNDHLKQCVVIVTNTISVEWEVSQLCLCVYIMKYNNSLFDHLVHALINCRVSWCNWILWAGEVGWQGYRRRQARTDYPTLSESIS